MRLRRRITGTEEHNYFKGEKVSLTGNVMNGMRLVRESVPSIHGEYLCSDSNCVPLSLQTK